MMTRHSNLVILLLFLRTIITANAKSVLLELSPDTYYNNLMPGRTSLLYFSADKPSSNIFLEELQRAVEPLQDYGIFVAKVNCFKEDIPKYCSAESAYLFRGAKLLREFPTDALFDVNAIVANVLFVLLYNEVKYITSVLELNTIEDDAKGKKNVVFIYIRAIGIPEHRSVMEAAYVYGSKYQFVLTTETTVLESVSSGESDIVSGKLFFSHCKVAKCRRTLLDQPITIVNIHRFLKLMEAALVTDISGDIENVTSLHLQLGLPMVFILSQQETYDADRITAEHLAWQLMGKAGLAILLREKSNIPLNINVALKSADENVPVKYMLLEETQQIVDLFVATKNEHREEAEDNLHSDQDVQDDEVAEAVYRDRKRVLPLQLVPSLTEDSFVTSVNSTSRSVVLFYASWEAVSLTFLRSFLDMAVKYKDIMDVFLGRVNCGDWPYLCKEQSIINIPAAKIYQNGKEPLLYNGMMGTEELFKFIMLSKVDCPFKLLTMAEAENYLNWKHYEHWLPYQNLSVLGICTPYMKEAVDTFMDAGKNLRGFAIMGIYCGENASDLASKYSTTLPAIIFARRNKIYGISVQNVAASEIVHLIKREILGVFPEVRVENLPSLFSHKKPLLILFSDGNLNHNNEKSISNLEKGNYLEPYGTCWLNLKNTPVGNGILQHYFGFVPHLPVLVLIHFDTMGKVFAFPSDQYLTEVNILYWLEMIKAGEEQPVYSLSSEDWIAPLPDYDFLTMMDATLPDFAAQKIRIHLKSSSRSKRVDDLSERTEAEETEAKQTTGKSLRGTVPKFIEKEKRFKHHSEL
ncbi:thioredoxin domain-containing protein 16 [Bombina bombina]|uniref:thioredoxin domain-containing protein 16 n=1 Tax=Bombina bombina TaxID=8345 RepID=UPI00235A6078|nr:thioredoxin domain-containing protein 16 [Bombina bombina]XP_053553592.1 thioredoxin domain-containing protein 16 [Bombina bombina]